MVNLTTTSTLNREGKGKNICIYFVCKQSGKYKLLLPLSFLCSFTTSQDFWMLTFFTKVISEEHGSFMILLVLGFCSFPLILLFLVDFRSISSLWHTYCLPSFICWLFIYIFNSVISIFKSATKNITTYYPQLSPSF
jgi:hypothetical protein